MIILIVDDEQYRHDSAEKHLTKDHVLLHAYNVTEALQVIQGCQARIGLALLDHDLQDFGKEETSPAGIILPDVGKERTGSTLASAWLGMDENKHPARVIAISNNFNGAHNITSKFNSAGVHAAHRPFDLTLMRDLAEELREQ